MGFPTKNDHFGVFWGYHHLRNHPNIPFVPWIRHGSPVWFVEAFGKFLGNVFPWMEDKQARLKSMDEKAPRGSP